MKNEFVTLYCGICGKDKNAFPLTWKGYGKITEENYPRDKHGNLCLPIKIDNPYRQDFEFAFLSGNGNCCNFFGLVETIGKNKICFSRVVFDDGDYFCSCKEYCEEHVWVYVDKDAKNSIPKDLKPGDKIEFVGDVYMYRRRNGTIDFGIENFDFIDKIDYKIPTKAELEKSHTFYATKNLICETCTFYEKCDLLTCLKGINFESVRNSI